MRILILYSALLSTMLSTVGLAATPAQAEGYAFSQSDSSRHNRDYRSRSDRSRDDQPRFDRHRDDYRYGGYRRYTPRYSYYGKPYYGKPWYKYPRRYYYPRYRDYDLDDDFWGWLAFTAITLAIIDSLNEQQQREHELALQDALRAPIGETIRWEDRDASGSVTMIREGTSSVGRHCREYTQKIEIGGESQQVYGTACRNRDGSWEIMK